MDCHYVDRAEFHAPAVARYADLARQQKGGNVYIEELGERVEMASKKSQALFDA